MNSVKKRLFPFSGLSFYLNSLRKNQYRILSFRIPKKLPEYLRRSTICCLDLPMLATSQNQNELSKAFNSF